MLAVIRTGGKQYIVSEGDKLEIEKIDKKEGEKIKFKEVLLVEKDGKVKVGNPLVKGAIVEAQVIAQKKGKKVKVVKYKPKTRYLVKKGHRQLLTEIEIVKIKAG